MTRSRMFGFFFAALILVACAATPPTTPREIKTCVDGATPADVGALAFSDALRLAQAYSDEVYGADCVVCAEVIDRPDEYMLHITSPGEDMLINTSAAITIRKVDGKVLNRSVWHSCHVHTRNTDNLTPND